MLLDRASQVTDNFAYRKGAPASAAFPLVFSLRDSRVIFRYTPNQLSVNAGGR